MGKKCLAKTKLGKGASTWGGGGKTAKTPITHQGARRISEKSKKDKIERKRDTLTIQLPGRDPSKIKASVKQAVSFKK